MVSIRQPCLIVLGATLVVMAACDGAVDPAGDPARTPDPVGVLPEGVDLPSPAGPGSVAPNLVTAADGRVLLSWFEPRPGDRHALRFAALDPAAATNGDGTSPAWSAPRTIVEGADFFVNWADFPSLAVLDDGSMAAHWPRRSGPDTFDYDVELAWSRDGGASWSEPMVPHGDGTASEHGFVSLFPWHDGSLAAVWLDGRTFAGWDEETAAVVESARPDDPEMQLRFTTLTPEGPAPDVLLDGRICDCCQTSAAVTAEGPVVVYRDRSPQEVRDISVIRHVDGGWTRPASVHDDGWEIHGCPVNGPMVDAHGAHVAVAWFTAAEGQPRVRIAFSSDAAASFTAPFEVATGNPEGRVAVRLLPDGAAAVTWLERLDGGAEIRMRRVSPGGEAGPPMRVAGATAARAGGFPRMTRSGDRLVFAWTDAGEPSSIRTALARVPAAAGEAP